MERVRRLRELWSWLPAFRAAAETEHLPTAAELLHVGASSISRTVRLLEDELGVALFERSGRSIKLNHDGRRFLAAVRDAMRILDEGIDAISRTAVAGAVHLAVPRYLIASLAVPAVEDLAVSAPKLTVHLHDGSERGHEELLRGTLDAAVQLQAIEHPDISVELLGRLEYGVYCAPTHPLASARRITTQALADHAFVVSPGDGWPPHALRTIGARAPDPAVAASICTAGHFVASLPQLLVNHAPGILTKLPIAVSPPSSLYLTYRRPVTDHARTNSVLAALRRQAAATTPTPQP